MEGTKRGHVRREKSLRCIKKRKQQKYALTEPRRFENEIYRNSNSLDHVNEEWPFRRYGSRTKT